LRYQSNWAAGKNKFINGDFGVNQRNFSSTTTDGDYTFDRWKCALASGTVTWSAQTFTPGAAPVAGYEGKNFIRSVVSGQTTSGQFAFISQRIEDVRTLAGQTVTVSFWAKASGTTTINSSIQQVFGSGGSSEVAGLSSGTFTLTTSWVRYSYTGTLANISGKTVGANSYAALRFNFPINATFTVDLWGVQLEAGSVATPFTPAGGGFPGAELALCQRYYWRQTASTAYSYLSTWSPAFSTTTVYGRVVLPVTMRVAPTSLDFSTIGVTDEVNFYSGGTITLDSQKSTGMIGIKYIHTSAALIQFRPYAIGANNSTSAYIALEAEL
jgi:hypothetical protein